MKTNFEIAPADSARCGLAPVSTARCVSEVAFPETTPDLAPKRILVPVDFSEASLKALKHAEAFAEQFGASICLAHVVEDGPAAIELLNRPVATLNQDRTLEARARLRAMGRTEVSELVPVEVQVRIGDPFPEIVALASELGSDLIVIGTHSNTGLKHLMLGGTTEGVVRYASCPVLVVRESGNVKRHN